MTAIRVILGDQLTHNLSALRDGDPKRDVIVMAEVDEEISYVPHHRMKIAFILAAMRRFAHELRERGWRVIYSRIDTPGGPASLTAALESAVRECAPTRIIATHAGEHRVRAIQSGWRTPGGYPAEIREDERFICSRADFERWAEGRRQLRMEYFYREMRRRTGLLMDRDQPVGGQWNFDSENRKPPRDLPIHAGPRFFEPDGDTQEALRAVAARLPDGYGDIGSFGWAVSHAQAHEAFRAFLDESLPLFGDYQDAMLDGSPFMNHACISAYLNTGLLDPLDVCRRAEDEWRAGRAPLNAVEGFIRQIIGWREFIRGVYWLEGPSYVDSNALGARRPLPDFYWTAQTDLNCLRACLEQTRTYAYAHHIQRLMVTGNFALLAGLDPQAVHEWYLSVYIDAFEWVEAPNTLGMSLYADGGRFATKPYAASGAYINRMSNYCQSCRYDVKKRIGDDACPFNALYWDFFARHEDRFAANPRCAQIVRTWRNMPRETQDGIRAQAAAFLQTLKSGQPPSST